MPRQLIYIAAFIIIVGILPLPYGYYMFLRFVACGVFAWAAYIAFQKNEEYLPWVFIILAIVFNPIIKIYFQKEIWIPIDACSGLLLLFIRKRIQCK
jgi:hypothetical protein